jgi:sarcosine oxidase, subunit beta
MRVVVIGAGIVGITAALTLAEGGVEVVVLERGPVAREASGLNAGIIGGGGWGDTPNSEVKLKMGSRDRFIDLSQRRGYDIGLDLTGTLSLIRTEAEWDWAVATVEADRRAGRELELLSSSELIGLEPTVDPRLLGAILDPLGARAEPVAATQAFAAEALAAGAIIETGCTVTGLRPLTGGGWVVQVATRAPLLQTRAMLTEDAVLGADAVIIAAGPWCAELGAMVGVEVPIVAVRGQMWASDPQPLLLRHAIRAARLRRG